VVVGGICCFNGIRQRGSIVFVARPPRNLSLAGDFMTDLVASPLLTLEIQIEGNTALVLCHGKLVSTTMNLLSGPVSHLIAEHERIVLDLAGLDQMDSMGLGTLVRLYASARSKGRVFELRNLAKKVRDLLILTNLISVFSIAGEHGVGIH
jgi:anti-sigma B factor antagonist